MVWFLSGVFFGAFMYYLVNQKTKPDYNSIAYIKTQIAEHDMMSSYYKTILDNTNKQVTKKQS